MRTPKAGVTPVLSVRGVSKRFGAVQALADVTLDFHAGEIHAVLGENGAGKSTLMNILGGLYRSDAGTIVFDGRPLSLRSPRAARAAGIGMVHQHFTLIDTLTVAENVALSLPRSSRWRFDAAADGRATQALARQLGLSIGAPQLRVAELPVGARQRLEILKAWARAGRLLILDEPTAILTPQETQQLFAMLRALRAQGQLVIFITHKLREVSEVADRVTIMRRGQVVGTYDAADITASDMAERMVGEVVPAAPAERRALDGAVALRVVGVSVRHAQRMSGLDDVSFAVRQGEIFGIAGVDGNGQRELFEVLVGLALPVSGSLTVGDVPITVFTPSAALAAGIGHIPPDRRREGLVLAMSLLDNFLLNRTVLNRFSRHGLLRRAAARHFVMELAHRYAIRLPDLQLPMRVLSGGNQQRVIVARELAEHPAVLVAVNPTRGLDISATTLVAGALREAARRGCAVVLISTDLDEVLDLSDRVGVLSRGRLSGPLSPPIDLGRLGLLMAGAA